MKDWLSWTCLKPVIYLRSLKPEESFSLLIHLFEKYLMKRTGKMPAATELIFLWQERDSKQVSKGISGSNFILKEWQLGHGAVSTALFSRSGKTSLRGDIMLKPEWSEGDWWGFPSGPEVKNLPCSAGDTGSIPALRKISHPTCSGATKPVYHNYWACVLEPGSCSYWAPAP